MPLPLIIAAPALASAAIGGIVKGVDGISKYRDAKDTDNRARELFEAATAEADELRARCESALIALGEQRLAFFDTEMPAFIACVSRLRNADIAASAFHDVLPDDVVDDGVLHDVVLRQIEALGTAAAGGIAGLAASQAATFGVTSLAAASTGAAISSLSGAAASNATLAWLGGGTLASGGGGVALGSTVLAGVAAAPALLVGGLVLSSVAGKKLAQAEENEREVQAHVARLAAAAEVWKTAMELASEATPVLGGLRTELAAMTDRIDGFADDEADVREWDVERRAELRAAGNLAGLGTALGSCPLIASDGLIDPRFAGLIEQTSESIG